MNFTRGTLANYGITKETLCDPNKQKTNLFVAERGKNRIKMWMITTYARRILPCALRHSTEVVWCWWTGAAVYYIAEIDIRYHARAHSIHCTLAGASLSCSFSNMNVFFFARERIQQPPFNLYSASSSSFYSVCIISEPVCSNSYIQITISVCIPFNRIFIQRPFLVHSIAHMHTCTGV